MQTVILNPASGGGRTGHDLSHIRQRLDSVLGPHHFVETRGPGDATRLTREALEQGSRLVVAIGGDGTFHEVINGFFQNGQPAGAGASLALVPRGSGGDFRRTFDLPDGVEAALERIRTGRERTIDAGRLTSTGEAGEALTQFFVNVSSLGLTAEIGVGTNASRCLKRVNGTLAFNWNILKATLRHRRFPLRLRTGPSNDDVSDWDANCIAVCNGRFFGAGVCISRDADPSSGALDVVIVHGRSPWQVLSGVGKLKRDTTNPMPEGMITRRLETVAIECRDPARRVLIEADGEFAGYLPARWETVPGAIKLIV